jgi:excisionase family DNA binding protein
MNRLMKIPEVAGRLEASKSFVYDLISSGRLKHYRLGKGQGGIRVSEEQLREYLKSRERGGESVPPPQKPRRPRGAFRHLKV